MKSCRKVIFTPARVVENFVRAASRFFGALAFF